jgi:hypothetical protein
LERNIPLFSIHFLINSCEGMELVADYGSSSDEGGAPKEVNDLGVGAPAPMKTKAKLAPSKKARPDVLPRVS